MELRAGYKQTEIGVIPEEWDAKLLKQISPSQSVGLVINPSSYYDDAGTVPMLVGSNIQENSIDWDAASRISNASNHLIPSSRLSAGDLVTVRVGEPGVTAVVPPELDGCNCASMMIIRHHRSFNSLWLSYVMNSRLGRMQVEHVQYGTAQKQFNISDAINFVYAVPPQNEQTVIANALSDTDVLIQALQKLITKKRQIKQGAMQTLLNPFENGVLKAGWSSKKLGDVADIRSGGTPSTNINEFWNGDVLWCTPTDITALNGNKYISNTNRKITSQGLKNSSAETIPAHSVVMTTRATIGECAINLVPISTNQGFKNFVAYASTDVDFLYYLLQTKKTEFIGLCSGSTFLEISKYQVFNFEIALPEEKTEQTRIATILSNMDADIAALETKLAKYQKIKQGMMQNLLTGRIRLV